MLFEKRLLWDMMNLSIDLSDELKIKRKKILVVSDKHIVRLGFIYERMIFRFENKFYEHMYIDRIRNYVDLDYYIKENMVECLEVFPVEKTIIVYE